MPASKKVRIWLIVIGLCLALLVGLGAWLYWATSQVPPWYRQATTTVDVSVQTKAGAQMERHLADLVSAFESTGRWEILFTEEEINAWLAHSLPKKHPDLLPEGFSDPRVHIEPDGISGACRVERGAISGVVSLKVDVRMAQPNVCNARIRRARLGSLPWPLDKIITAANRTAREAEIPLSWKQAGGDPVAVVRIPLIEDDKHVSIETLQLEEGKIYLAGVTKRIEP